MFSQAVEAPQGFMPALGNGLGMLRGKWKQRARGINLTRCPDSEH
jgi:hypothetical protein